MKKQFWLMLCLLFGLFGVSSLLAAGATSDTKELQTKLNAISSMTADFTEVILAGKREVSHSTGTMALERPGRFRWDTQSPLSQLVVLDGKKLWIYDKDLEQVTVKNQEEGLNGTPALFLSKSNDTVARDFNVIKLTQDQKKDETLTYELRAKKSKENFQRLRLAFLSEKLVSIEFFDQLGQHTTVHFSQIKENPKLADTLFQFKPPKGVDVVRQ
jgi:outer membrane lipoprotein carrier protein